MVNLVITVVIVVTITTVTVIIYHCVATQRCVQREESELVKLAMPVIPMLDDYAWNDPRSMTKYCMI